MASSRGELTLAVGKRHLCERQGLANLFADGSALEGVAHASTGAQICDFPNQIHTSGRRLVDSPLRSVDTPVAKRPVDATAREPPRSTRLAMVPP